MGTFPHKQFLGIEMKEREQDSGGWRISSVLNHGLRQKRVSFKRSIADSHTYANYWAPYHQTNSNMQKYPSETINRPIPHMGDAPRTSLGEDLNPDLRPQIAPPPSWDIPPGRNSLV